MWGMKDCSVHRGQCSRDNSLEMLHWTVVFELLSHIVAYASLHIIRLWAMCDQHILWFSGIYWMVLVLHIIIIIIIIIIIGGGGAAITFWPKFERILHLLPAGDQQWSCQLHSYLLHWWNFVGSSLGGRPVLGLLQRDSASSSPPACGSPRSIGLSPLGKPVACLLLACWHWLVL